MKFAIDRIKISSEEEVHAASFYGSYIPQRKTRFFCPECGEQVFWSSRGGIQPDKFNHYTKTASSPECDKRVDGRSELSLYERVGLPMSLEQIRESIFRLNIVFPAIGEQPLEMAAKQNYKICVSSADQKRIFPIDFTYFQADAATLIPVDFVPLQDANYRIQVDAGDEIKKRWSDYSDGFAQGGAIFTYEEVGGKKVKRGDCIATGRQYYVVARQFCSPYGEIQSECVGSIQLNESPYSVYTVSVDVSPEDGNRYALISEYLKSLFGVWLLETAPGLTALWPPVTEQDVFVPIKNTSNLYCMLEEEHLSVSIGLSWNKTLSKFASELKKPNGIRFIVRSSPEDESWKDMVYPHEVDEMVYIGRARKRDLNRIGVYTLSQMAELSEQELVRMWGVEGRTLYSYVQGTENQRVYAGGMPPPTKSFSNGSTTPRDLTSWEEFWVQTCVMAERVGQRMREHRMLARTVEVGLTFVREDGEMDYRGFQCGLAHPTCLSMEIAHGAFALMKKKFKARPIRKITVRVKDLLYASDPRQCLLTVSAARQQQLEELEYCLDDLNERWPMVVRRFVTTTDSQLAMLGIKRAQEFAPPGVRAV